LFHLVESEMVKVMSFWGGHEGEVVPRVWVECDRDDDGVPDPHRQRVGPAQDRAHASGQQIGDEMFCGMKLMKKMIEDFFQFDYLKFN